MCGGSPNSRRFRHRNRGLSPRVRGKQGRIIADLPSRRSIPACAGEAGKATPAAGVQRVYPRVCGGSQRPPPFANAVRGLSPRVRGKHRRRRPVQLGSGSIPACAGEAADGDGLSGIPAVYPRVCGGSAREGAPPFATEGLSPRVRGKRRLPADRPACPRSIPACAGEAERLTRIPPLYPVYPRVCGGSVVSGLLEGVTAGLSPRVRGKPSGRRRGRWSSWSIPACAGEA